ncbi:hypothetical protein F4703DRAFT_1488610 [Phycomyces blakesleeanus]
MSQSFAILNTRVLNRVLEWGQSKYQLLLLFIFLPRSTSFNLLMSLLFSSKWRWSPNTPAVSSSQNQDKNNHDCLNTPSNKFIQVQGSSTIDSFLFFLSVLFID